MLSDEQVSALRSRFPIFKEKIYLDSSSQGPLCEQIELHDSPAAYEALRNEFAGFINAHPDEISVFPSTTDALAAIAPGPIAQVDPMTGSRADLMGLARRARERGELVFVDGDQDCGTRPIDVKASDIEIYVTTTARYLLSPPGFALLYVKRSPANIALRVANYERSVPISSVLAARSALRFLSSTGMDNVSAHISQLTRAFMQGTRALRIVSKTPDTSAGPLVVLHSAQPEALVHQLALRGIVVSARLDGVCFSFHVYNNFSDVHAVLAVLESNLPLLARRTDKLI